MVEIRRLRADEWRELRDLRLESLRDAPTAFWMTYEEELGTSDDGWREWVALPCFVAVDDERLVGMVLGAPDEDHRELANLYAMYVTPLARGRGIGAALVEAHLDWARSESFKRVRLMVNIENGNAIGLYERCGFRDTGAREPLRDGPHILAEMIRGL